MKDFLEIDKEEADLPSRPDNEETRNTKVDVQAHSGSTRTVGTASSTVMKTQYYKKTATSSGLSMTMSISAQTRAE